MKGTTNNEKKKGCRARDWMEGYSFFILMVVVVSKCSGARKYRIDVKH